MAEVKKVTLKRFNGTDDDTLHPTTEWEQVENKPSTFTPTAHSLNSHTDVDANPTSDGQVLTWDATNNIWIASDSSGGVDKSDLQNVYVYGKADAAITKGQAIQFAGVQGDHILIKPAVPSEINAEPTLIIGIAETDLALNEFGYVIVNGRLNLDTSAYEAGDLLYFASAGSTAGALTTTEPTDPNASIQMAAVSIDGVGTGEFIVRTTILTRQINEVIGLQGALDGKVSKSGDTMTATLTVDNPTAAYNSFVATNGTQNISMGVNNSEGVFIFGNTNHDLRFGTNNSEKVRITSGGNVGIGTTSPNSILQINTGSGASTANTLVLNRPATTNYHGLTFSTSGTEDWSIGQNSTGGFQIYENGSAATTRLTIKDGGNVGIGTTTPGQKLHVVGDTRIEGDLTVNGTVTMVDTDTSTTEQWLVTNDGTGPAVIINQTGAQPVIDIQDDGTSAFYIADGGLVGIGTTSPDAKLNIVSTGIGNSPSLAIDNTSSTTYNHSIEMFAANLTAGENNLITIGKSGDTKNTGVVGYEWNANADNSNILWFGHWGSNHLVNITGDGKVGIGTKTPDTQLHIGAPLNIPPKIRLELNDSGSSINNNQEYASIQWEGNDAQGSGVRADIRVFGEGTSGETYMTFGTMPAGTSNATSATERMRINSAGIVTMKGNLEIVKDNPVIVLRDTGETNDTDHVGYFSFQDSASVEKAWLGFGSSNTTDFQIVNNYLGDINLIGGNVGVGTPSPKHKLDVVGNSHVRALNANTTQSIIYLNGGQDSQWKTAIIANPVGDWARQDLHFALNSTQDVSAATTAETKMIIKNDGKVGIGETTPLGKLHTKDGNVIIEQGDLYIASSSNAEGGEDGGGSGTPAIWFSESEGTDVVQQAFGIRYDGDGKSGAANRLEFVATDIKMVIENGGNVGIGTDNPTSKLQVNGAIKISDVNDLNIGYFSTVENGFINFNYNNHADTLIGTNMKLNADHDVQTVNAHPKLRGSAIVFGGNGHPNGENTINFYSKPSGTATAGTVYTAESAEMVLKQGNLGIGTTSPSRKLQVGSYSLTGQPSPDPTADIVSSGGIVVAPGTFVSYDGAYSIHAQQRYNSTTGVSEATFEHQGYYGHNFQTRDRQSRMVIIGGSGNVGIGITNPHQKLQVQGAVAAGLRSSTGLPNTTGVTTQMAFEARSTQAGNEPSIAFHKESVYTMYLQGQNSPRGLNLYAPSTETAASLFVQGAKVVTETAYATSTTGGTVKMRVSSGVLYIRNDGNNA